MKNMVPSAEINTGILLQLTACSSVTRISSHLSAGIRLIIAVKCGLNSTETETYHMQMQNRCNTQWCTFAGVALAWWQVNSTNMRTAGSINCCQASWLQDICI